MRFGRRLTERRWRAITLFALFAVVLLVFMWPASASLDLSFDPARDVQPEINGITVTWVSPDEEDGHVEWAVNATDLANRSGSFSITEDERGELEGRLNRRTHRVRAVGVVPGPGNMVHYRIVSGGQASQDYQVALPQLPLFTPPDILAGTVFDEEGDPAAECLVYMRIGVQVFFGETLVTDAKSLRVNTMTAENGFYALDVTNLRTEGSIDDVLQYSPNNATVTIAAVCDHVRRGETVSAFSELEQGSVGPINVNVQVQVVEETARAAPAPPLPGGEAAATPTNTSTPLPTATLAPTSTPVPPSPTSTPLPPSSTPTASPAPATTQAPATATPSPLTTATVVPPATATPVPTPSVTASPTVIVAIGTTPVVSPTATPAVQQSPTVSPTPTDVPSTVPTATPRPSAATAITVPTATTALAASSTETATATAQPAASVATSPTPAESGSVAPEIQPTVLTAESEAPPAPSGGGCLVGEDGAGGVPNMLLLLGPVGAALVRRRVSL